MRVKVHPPRKGKWESEDQKPSSRQNGTLKKTVDKPERLRKSQVKEVDTSTGYREGDKVLLYHEEEFRKHCWAWPKVGVIRRSTFSILSIDVDGIKLVLPQSEVMIEPYDPRFDSVWSAPLILEAADNLAIFAVPEGTGNFLKSDGTLIGKHLPFYGVRKEVIGKLSDSGLLVVRALTEEGSSGPLDWSGIPRFSAPRVGVGDVLSCFEENRWRPARIKSLNFDRVTVLFEGDKEEDYKSIPWGSVASSYNRPVPLCDSDNTDYGFYVFHERLGFEVTHLSKIRKERCFWRSPSGKTVHEKDIFATEFQALDEAFRRNLMYG